MTRVIIQWQDKFGRWQRDTEMNNQANAFRSGQARARSTGRQHRLGDRSCQLIELITRFQVISPANEATDQPIQLSLLECA